MSDHFFCPNCGAEVPQGALACPACGSDRETGWSKEARYQDLGFFVWDDAEPPDGPSRSFRPSQSLLAILSLLTIAAFLAYIIPGGIYLAPIVLLGGGLAYYWTRIRSGTHDPVQDHLYRRLLAKARGDSALVERLVDYERQRNPDASRARLLQNAIDRWERDL